MSSRQYKENKENSLGGRGSGLGSIPKSMIEKNNARLVN